MPVVHVWHTETLVRFGITSRNNHLSRRLSRAIPVSAGIELFRKSRTRNSHRGLGAATRHSSCIHSKTGRRRLAWFRFHCVRIQGK